MTDPEKSFVTATKAADGDAPHPHPAVRNHGISPAMLGLLRIAAAAVALALSLGGFISETLLHITTDTSVIDKGYLGETVCPKNPSSSSANVTCVHNAISLGDRTCTLDASSCNLFVTATWFFVISLVAAAIAFVLALVLPIPAPFIKKSFKQIKYVAAGASAFHALCLVIILILNEVQLAIEQVAEIQNPSKGGTTPSFGLAFFLMLCAMVASKGIVALFFVFKDI